MFCEFMTKLTAELGQISHQPPSNNCMNIMLYSYNQNKATKGFESKSPNSILKSTGIWTRVGVAIGLLFGIAACTNNAKFNSSLYGPASPQVIKYGDPVPKGGGRQVIGKPYVIAGKKYYPKHDPNYSAVGRSSWYGRTFHGRLTSNGEVFDMDGLSAAHPTMPLPSYARVTNLSNGSSLVLRVNDRGPFYGNRIVDVSDKAATVLGFKHRGIAKVKVEYVGPASLAGDDYKTLALTYNAPGESKTSISQIATILNPPIPIPKPVFASNNRSQTASLGEFISDLTTIQPQQKSNVIDSPVPKLKPNSS